MYSFTRMHLAPINLAIFGHPGIVVQSLSPLSSLAPQPD